MVFSLKEDLGEWKCPDPGVSQWVHKFTESSEVMGCVFAVTGEFDDTQIILNKALNSTLLPSRICSAYGPGPKTATKLCLFAPLFASVSPSVT
jgi:hypothetical protein